MRVEPGGGAGCVLRLLEVDPQRLAQARRRGFVVGQRTEDGRDELSRPAWIMGRERGDLKFPISGELAAGGVAQQQPVHRERGLVTATEPLDATAGRADCGTYIGG